ncbi:MAG: GNAT family N-acetyltransferase [Gemmatimonadales bacterium]
MDPSREHTGGASLGWLERLRERTAETGVRGAFTAGLNRILQRGASIDLVHVLLLEADRLRDAPVDASFEVRFLTSDEVRRHATRPGSGLSPEFADRIDRGHDLCIAALSEGRLASYSWLALGSVEPEHAAGVALGLPTDTAYLYKAFTHRSFRGRRLYGAITASALRQLEGAGVTRFVAFVYWNNASALRACARMGYRRLGMLAARPGKLLRVPGAAERCGIRFGSEAQPLLATRRGREAVAGRAPAPGSPAT